MKRKYTQDCSENKVSKMSKMFEIEDNFANDGRTSDIVAPVTELKRTFGYRLTDKKTKSNLLKGAVRAPFTKEQNQLSVNLDFYAGSYKNVVMPIIKQWDNVKDKEIETTNFKVKLRKSVLAML